VGLGGSERPVHSHGQGAMGSWLKSIGRSEKDICKEGVSQNSAHLRQCLGIGDGRGRSMAEVYGDMEWYRAVFTALNGVAE